MGSSNVATGSSALSSNTSGHDNVAAGLQALYQNRAGAFNVATGTNALNRNTAGRKNVAEGFKSLYANTKGDENVAIGQQALAANTTRVLNVAIGANAGSNLTTGAGNVDIANAGVAGESTTIRIGDGQNATFVDGISGSAIPGPAAPVVVNAQGQLGTSTTGPKPLRGSVATALAAQNRRQSRRIAALEREVRSLQAKR